MRPMQEEIDEDKGEEEQEEAEEVKLRKAPRGPTKREREREREKGTRSNAYTLSGLVCTLRRRKSNIPTTQNGQGPGGRGDQAEQGAESIHGLLLHGAEGRPRA